MANPGKRTRTTTNTMQHKQEDQLSPLPDAILLEILSHLPIKLAVKTGVLSRRWRNLWTLITPLNLDLEDTCSNKPYDMFPFIEKLVSQFASPGFTIQRCSLRVGDAYSSISDDCIDACFKQICSRNIQGVDVHTTYNKDKIWSLKLSPCIFQMRSLVTLNLVSSYHQCGFNMHRVTDIYLPMLKKLNVDRLLIYHPGNWGIVENLVKSCPALEDLCLHLFSFEGNSTCSVRLPGQNLKRVDINLCYKTENDGLVTFVIDAPKVEFLEIYLEPGANFGIDNSLAKLIKSQLWTDCSMTDAYKLFRAVSNARSLDLNLDIPKKSVFANIRFTKLTYLKLSECRNSSREDLISLLQVCPALEDLVLYLYTSSFDKSWDPSDSPPQCFLTQLKRIEIKVEWNRLKKELLHLTLCLLRIANNLERLVFDATLYNFRQYDVDYKLKIYCKEFPFCQKLFEAAPSHCQIEFHGVTYSRRS